LFKKIYGNFLVYAAFMQDISFLLKQVTASCFIVAWLVKFRPDFCHKSEQIRPQQEKE
jgi:hypothetical protein